MQRTSAVLGTAIFFVVAPFLAAAIVPWWITRWQFRPAFLDLELTRAIGGVLIVAGVPGIVDSFARFALQGLGTPAPVAPPQKLVVTGLYRYVRNPMYVSALAIVLGQALLFGDWRLIVYTALFWLACHAYDPVRRADAAAQICGGVRCLPRKRPALDPATKPLAGSLGTVVDADRTC
jgi:protein-S-isoprenylcysteine O-methyltransferase Ste14